MVRLQSPDKLSAELEKGIGVEGTYYEAIDEHLRLRLPVGRLASVALSLALRAQGNEVSIMQSHPHFTFEPGFTHVFPVVHDQTGDTIIDPTYSSVLNLAGMTAERVILGSPDLFPEEKIATFRPEDRALIAVELTRAARNGMSYVADDGAYFARRPRLRGMALTRMKGVFSDIWNPDNFSHFRPDHDLRYAGQTLAAHISAESVRFIAP